MPLLLLLRLLALLLAPRLQLAERMGMGWDGAIRSEGPARRRSQGRPAAASLRLCVVVSTDLLCVRVWSVWMRVGHSSDPDAHTTTQSDEQKNKPAAGA